MHSLTIGLHTKPAVNKWIRFYSQHSNCNTASLTWIRRQVDIALFALTQITGIGVDTIRIRRAVVCLLTVVDFCKQRIVCREHNNTNILASEHTRPGRDTASGLWSMKPGKHSHKYPSSCSIQRAFLSQSCFFAAHSSKTERTLMLSITHTFYSRHRPVTGCRA